MYLSAVLPSDATFLNNAHINVNFPPPPPPADPRNSDEEQVCLSESPSCHKLSLSDSPPKISICLPFAMSECQKEHFVVLVPCMVRRIPVICLGGGEQVSLWQVHNEHRNINFYSLLFTSKITNGHSLKLVKFVSEAYCFFFGQTFVLYGRFYMSQPLTTGWNSARRWNSAWSWNWWLPTLTWRRQTF